MLVRVRAVAVVTISETLMLVRVGGTHQQGRQPGRRCILSVESSGVSIFTDWKQSASQRARLRLVAIRILLSRTQSNSKRSPKQCSSSRFKGCPIEIRGLPHEDEGRSGLVPHAHTARRCGHSTCAQSSSIVNYSFLEFQRLAGLTVRNV